MEKRVLLAVVLSFIVLYSWQAIFPPPAPQRPSPPPPRPATAPAGEPTTPKAAADPATSPAGTPGAALVEAPAALVADAAERDIVVENSQVRALFTTRGAALKSWRLKQYKNTTGEPFELLPQ